MQKDTDFVIFSVHCKNTREFIVDTRLSALFSISSKENATYDITPSKCIQC